MTKTIIRSTNENKAAYVNEMFSKIAKKYDLLNNLMTFGLHKRWKKKAIKLALAELNHHSSLITSPSSLDLCCGTCDLAIILNKLYPSFKITCVDNCSEMLDIARHKIENLKLKNISIQLLDSENLSFKSSSFDLITIGFGLRNLVNKEKCIEDIYRLLRDNSVFACIDLGHPTNIIWEKIFFDYFFRLVPILGKIFAGNKDAYTYLPNSLMNWYKQEELKELILKKGFKKCYFKNILGGIVAIHIATK